MRESKQGMSGAVVHRVARQGSPSRGRQRRCGEVRGEPVDTRRRGARSSCKGPEACLTRPFGSPQPDEEASISQEQRATVETQQKGQESRVKGKSDSRLCVWPVEDVTC